MLDMRNKKYSKVNSDLDLQQQQNKNKSVGKMNLPTMVINHGVAQQPTVQFR